MQYISMKSTCAVLTAFVLTACGGGGGGDNSGGVDSVPAVPTDPPDEVVDGTYADVSDRDADGTAGMAYVLLNGESPSSSDTVSITYESGAIAGGLLNGTDIDDPEFANPANGEYSRIVRIPDSSLFGAVGLDVQSGDLPTSGSTDYNEGWVGMIATLETNVYTLEGNATFSARWDDNRIDGQFVNLSGRGPLDNSVTNVGNIELDNAIIVGDGFSGGSVSGTGIFSGLRGSSDTSDTSGIFFGPDADELGGVLVINDNDRDIHVIGAFQSD